MKTKIHLKDNGHIEIDTETPIKSFTSGMDNRGVYFETEFYDGSIVKAYYDPEKMNEETFRKIQGFIQ